MFKKNLNKHRQIAHALLATPSNPTFQANATLFLSELKDVQHILNEINKIIDFEQPTERDK